MLFISVEDFFSKAQSVNKLSRDDEKYYSEKKDNGDIEAREKIVKSYLPLVASYIRRSPKEIQTLETIYSCVRSLEKGVDSLNFIQDSETFTHHLSWRLRQCITRCLVDRR